MGTVLKTNHKPAAHPFTVCAALLYKHSHSASVINNNATQRVSNPPPPLQHRGVTNTSADQERNNFLYPLDNK